MLRKREKKIKEIGKERDFEREIRKGVYNMPTPRRSFHLISQPPGVCLPKTTISLLDFSFFFFCFFVFSLSVGEMK